MKFLIPFLLIIGTLSYTECKLKEGAYPPSWMLNDENPLKKARDENRVVLLVLWKSSCAYCQSQAAKLYQWYQLLYSYRDLFKIIVVNKIGDEKSLMALDRVSRKSFYLYQDVEDTKVWERMEGEKDSMYIFNAEGKLSKQFHGKAASMGRKNPKCKHGANNEIIKHLLNELAPIIKDPTAKCDDANSIRYKRVVKGLLKRGKKNKRNKEIKKKNKTNKKNKAKKQKTNKKNKAKKQKKENKKKKNKKNKSNNKKNNKKTKKNKSKINGDKKRKRKERRNRRKEKRLNRKNNISDRI